ncbi:MAG: hypothetical protein ACREEM_03990 [Blastocatellia bacterium]
MPTDSKRDQPLQKGSKKIDDLTVIKGIGEALEQWLRESLKVHTFADLAALSALEVESRARREGRALSLSKIEQILAQARELAGASQSAVPGSGKPPKAKAEEVSAAPEKENEWKEFASFVVCFDRKVVGGKEEKRTTIERRTAIQHMETGEQASWSGVEAGQACQWMRERLSEKARLAPEEESLEVEPPSPTELPVPEPVALEVTGVQVFQPPSSDQPQDLYRQHRAFTGYVKGGEPLSFTVTFQLIGLGASEVIKGHKEFGVVFNAEDLITSTVARIGNSRPDFLKEGQFSYTAWLSPLALSQGMYRLKIVTTVRDIPLWAYTEVPLLQVA